jgi:F-type H+-transporting ATPase subunit b
VVESSHPTATTEVAEHAPAEQHEPVVFGFMGPTFWVALAMVALFAIFIWKRVPAAVAKALDQQIETIRNRLDEAASLRSEAEALKKEYQKKAKAADKEAAAMIERAKHEAEAIVAKADADAKALVERRTRMAEEKIAAEERAAINQLRASAAAAAAAAAEKLIAERLDASADAKLVDQAIAGLGKGV